MKHLWDKLKEHTFLAQQNHEVVITLSGSASSLTMDVKDENNNVINGEKFEGSNLDWFIFETEYSGPYTLTVSSDHVETTGAQELG